MALMQCIDEIKALEKEYLTYLGKDIIEDLVESQLAVDKGKYFEVLPVAISQLSSEELKVLGLPERYPYAIEINAKGNMGQADFCYSYHFVRSPGNPIISYDIHGAIISISEVEQYVLDEELFSLVRAIVDFNSQQKNENGETNHKTEAIRNNLLSFSKIKGLSKRTGAHLDSYLHFEEVIAPSQLGVVLRKTDSGAIEVEPTLYIDNSDSEECDKTEIAAEKQKEFVGAFDRFSSTRGTYPLKKGTRIVLSKEQEDGLENLKRIRRLEGDAKKKFLEAPQAFLDPDIFDLEKFGERVLEIGEYKHRIFPFIRPSRESWLPAEGGLVLDGELIQIAPDRVKTLHDEVTAAIERKVGEVDFDGKKIPAMPETLTALDALADTGMAQGESSQGESSDTVEKNLKQSALTRNVLIIRENLEDLDYTAPIAARLGTPEESPIGMRAGFSLLAHQTEGVRWLQKSWVDGHKGVVLADDMGLGKTLQAMLFMTWIRGMMKARTIDPRPMLVVAPVVLLENWKEEIARFIHDDVFGEIISLHGKELSQMKNSKHKAPGGVRHETDPAVLNSIQDFQAEGRGFLLDVTSLQYAGLCLTTYETLRDYQLSLGLVEWSVIVLDEAQKIKSPNAMVTTAIKAMKYEFGLCLTGTPVENSWVDLWSIMDFAQPGMLGSLKSFVKNYQTPLEKQETNREELGNSLKNIVEKHLLRRNKQDNLSGLPEKIIKIHEIQMPDVQVQTYMQVVNAGKNCSNANAGQNILKTIFALRDVSLHPYLVTHSEEAMANMPSDKLIEASARVKQTFELLREIRDKNEKALIFLLSRTMQRILKRLIEQKFGIECLRPINGELSGERRQEIVNSFQAMRGFQVLILSPEAAGIGLNITGANHVVHLSRAWNPAKEDQASDRIYRIGQEQTCYIHLPLAVHPALQNGKVNESFDVKLNRLLEQKRALSRSVLLPPEMDTEEIMQLGKEILGKYVDEEMQETFLQIEDVDGLTPTAFERLIAHLLFVEGYSTDLTPITKDYGADVVAISNDEKKKSLLVQCKHTSNRETRLASQGIQEILSAKGVYSKVHSIDFEMVVVTNAMDYTAQAKETASLNDVQLYSRSHIVKWLVEKPTRFSEIF